MHFLLRHTTHATRAAVLAAALRATSAAAQQAPDAPPAETARDVPPGDVDAALFVESPDHVQQVAVHLATNTERHCRTPCALLVPRGPVDLTAYGPGLVTTTMPIDVPQRGLTVTLRAASATSAAVGWLSIGIGATAVAVAGGAIGYAQYLASRTDWLAGLDASTGYYTIGGITALLGLPCLAIGIYLATQNQPDAVTSGVLFRRQRVSVTPVVGATALGLAVRF